MVRNAVPGHGEPAGQDGGGGGGEDRDERVQGGGPEEHGTTLGMTLLKRERFVVNILRI